MVKRKRTYNDLQNIHIQLKVSNMNPTNIGGELRCCGRVSSSYSTSGTCRLHLVGIMWPKQWFVISLNLFAYHAIFKYEHDVGEINFVLWWYSIKTLIH
jgi:hypothetical protein